jgi:hypothetical protein
LSDIFALNLEKIADIEGFAELTAQAVVTGLQDIKNEFDFMALSNQIFAGFITKTHLG